MAATGGRGKEETFSLSGAWRRLEQEGRGAGQLGQEGQGRWWAQDWPCLLMAGGGHMRKSLLSPGLRRDYVDCGLQRCKGKIN